MGSISSHWLSRPCHEHDLTFGRSADSPVGRIIITLERYSTLTDVFTYRRTQSAYLPATRPNQATILPRPSVHREATARSSIPVAMNEEEVECVPARIRFLSTFQFQFQRRPGVHVKSSSGGNVRVKNRRRGTISSVNSGRSVKYGVIYKANDWASLNNTTIRVRGKAECTFK